jgi:hypothetical protein
MVSSRPLAAAVLTYQDCPEKKKDCELSESSCSTKVSTKDGRVSVFEVKDSCRLR